MPPILIDRVNPDADFQQTPQSQAFISYWKSLRHPGGGLIPRRVDFDPAAVVSLLPYLFISEIGSDDIYLRLVGTAMEERAQRRLTGMHYSEFVTRDSLKRSLTRLHTTFAQPCGLYRYFEESYSENLTSTVELTILPLLTGAACFGQTINLAMPLGYDKLAAARLRNFSFKVSDIVSCIDIGAGVPPGYTKLE